MHHIATHCRQDLIKVVVTTLRKNIVLSFFFTFDRSGPAIVFYFLTITEHVSYSSRKLPINTRYIRNSKDGGYYSRKDCGWFLIGLPIFDFLSNLSGPDMQ